MIDYWTPCLTRLLLHASLLSSQCTCCDICVCVHAGQNQDGIGGGFGRGRGSRGSNQDRGYYMPGRGPRGSSGPGIRERDLGVRAPSRGEANDYCQHFVDTAQRPQNFLRDVHLVGFHAISCTNSVLISIGLQLHCEQT